MYKMKHSFNYLYIFVALTGMGGVYSDAYSGAFSLYTEGSASAVGNFAAGVAAEARDASIGWYNPAGLALIRNQQVVLGATGVGCAKDKGNDDAPSRSGGANPGEKEA